MDFLLFNFFVFSYFHCSLSLVSVPYQCILMLIVDHSACASAERVDQDDVAAKSQALPFVHT